MAEKESSGNGKFFLGAALGVVVGTVAGVLMAPKSGKETRKDIKDGAVKATQKVKDGGKKLLGKGKKSAASAKANTEKVTAKESE